MICQETFQTTFKENCQLERKRKKNCIPLYSVGTYWHFALSITFYDQMNITAVTGCNVQDILHCNINLEAIFPQITLGRSRYWVIMASIKLPKLQDIKSADSAAKKGFSRPIQTPHKALGLILCNILIGFSMRNKVSIFLNRSLPQKPCFL